MQTFENDVKFEQHYAEVLAFVQKKKYASCFEMMKEFHISYADAAYLMDTLEVRGIVDVGVPKGPRPLLTERGRVLKKEREEREREEKKREDEKPKVESVIAATAATSQPVSEVRQRTRTRKR